MSRIGKLPIQLPQGVTVITKDQTVVASGPKGTLEQALLPGIKITSDNDHLTLARSNELPLSKARHGLMRSLIYNMVAGVSSGFERKLEIHGVGYRVQLAGSDLKFSLGFSHEVVYKIPERVQVSIEQNTITVQGIDKQRVGQVAAEIRGLKKPEPYKGKGIRYQDEKIIRKSGKSGKE